MSDCELAAARCDRRAPIGGARGARCGRYVPASQPASQRGSQSASAAVCQRFFDARIISRALSRAYMNTNPFTYIFSAHTYAHSSTAAAAGINNITIPDTFDQSAASAGRQAAGPTDRQISPARCYAYALVCTIFPSPHLTTAAINRTSLSLRPLQPSPSPLPPLPLSPSL